MYAAYLVALGFATAPWHIYAASVVGGIGAAAIIALPISYLLDMIRDRPGLSASLIAVNMFLGSAIGAGIFAAGSAIGGHSAAAILGAVVGLTGAMLLSQLERGKR